MLTLDNNNKNLLWADSFLIRESGALHLILNKKKTLEVHPLVEFALTWVFFFYLCCLVSVVQSCVLFLGIARNLLHTGLRWVIFSKNSSLI